MMRSQRRYRNQGAEPPKTPPAVESSFCTPARRLSRPWRKWLLTTGIIAGLVVAGFFLYPAVETALNTISTDVLRQQPRDLCCCPACQARSAACWSTIITV